VTEPIVAGALLRIGEHLVGLGELLELLLGLLVSLVLVRVELQGELAERALQLLRGAGPLDAEHLVVVALGMGLHAGFFLDKGGDLPAAPQAVRQAKRKTL